MKLLFIIVVTFSLLSQLKADGPPVDENGNVSVMHFVFYFDSLQSDQIQYSSYLELNDEQIQLLSKINPKIGRKMLFISPFYNDCTCGMNYAIWNKEKSFAIPLYNILSEDNDEESKELELEEYEEKSYWDFGDTYGASIFIGSDAKVYFGKKRISMEETYLIFKRISEQGNKSSKYINVRKPPKVNSEIDREVEKIIVRIEDIAKKYSIDFQIGG